MTALFCDQSSPLTTHVARQRRIGEPLPGRHAAQRMICIAPPSCGHHVDSPTKLPVLTVSADQLPWADNGPVSRTGRAPGKSADFPGVVGNSLPLVRLRRKDRISTPLVEKRPAPPTPWSGVSNFNLFQKSSIPRQKPIFHRGFTVTPCRLKAARHTPNIKQPPLHAR